MQIPDFVVPRLNTSSALGQALISMFRAIEMELTLEGASPGAVQVIVFGGCAVHLYTHHRVSTDVDAEIYCANTQDTLRLRTLLAEFPEQFFDEQSGRVMELNYDLQYNTSFGPLHEDYWERSLPLEEFPLESALHLHVAAPIDIAISKLGRATDQDVDDIMALLRAGFIVTAELRQLALQAIDMYVGNKEPPRSILTNILHDYLETADGEAL
ncbi:putative lipoprotein [Pseudomonas synxantha BG33R]|jgi:hypothetical protein|uniref:DUF6036 domain-containing protein n=2 Tax=Pseudomonas TaxID=286 RepID=A0A219A4S2_9PSED|nr:MULTISPECIES: DUF6036 family nucleotidyltransferase [Pseudomonas]MBD8560524.1 hypothetical protein [Pseudomonas fluorescens]MDE1533378.1 DUF6036 family nucleotidyltransferase [Pseudomonas carnis]EIK72263.1 putative lipoprotein [Pseudomonas synxantha BG33R]KRP69908.1 hypothetical protein TX23_21295 [Pseudomonas paralactis]KRP80109.1 hypothetical protein TX24_13610 [Pseudomonas lactis]